MGPPAEFFRICQQRGGSALARESLSPWLAGEWQVLMNCKGVPPILAQKHYGEGSAFTPENLLREARRQKAKAVAAAPSICVLDPDGDLVRRVRSTGAARLDPSWSC